MYEFPSVSGYYPREGPLVGGTLIEFTANGLGDIFIPLTVAHGGVIEIQCQFGQRVSVPAFYNPKTMKLECISPTSSSAGYPFGGTIPLDLNVNWLNGVAGTSVYQSIFQYRSFVFDVIALGPLSGPLKGQTIVEVTTSSPIPNNGLVYCVFGRHFVAADYRNDNTVWCSTPSSGNAGTVKFYMSIDGSSKSQFSFASIIGNATVNSIGPSYYTYYDPPTVSGLFPPSGSSIGGTDVLIEGNGFSGKVWDNPKCKFGDSIVPVILFLSTKALVCRSPPGIMGDVPVAVSNNGVDFLSKQESTTFFTYTETEAIVKMTPTLGPYTGGTVVIISAIFGTLPSAQSTGYVYDVADPPKCVFGAYSSIGVVDNPVSGNIRCISPLVSGPMSTPVVVYFNRRTAAYITDKFFFHAIPVITRIDPPLGPQGVPNTVSIFGENFVNSDSLKVRFGTLNVGSETVTGLYVSETEIRATAPLVSPSTLTQRLPVMVSNNGFDFVPTTIANWDPDDDSLDNIVEYYTLHAPITLRLVHPPIADMHGGGYVSVFGGPFVNTGISACGFDLVYTEFAKPIFISPTHILCPVPNMWAKGSPSAMSRTARLQVSLVNEFWSDQYLEFRFLVTAPPGFYVPHITAGGEWSSSISPCTQGHTCEVGGLSQPLQCPPGTYQPYTGQRGCLPCPRGFYCSFARTIKPTVCQPGYMCDEEGLISPYKLCPSGYVCLAGTATSDPLPDEPYNALTPSNQIVQVGDTPIPGYGLPGFNGPHRCPRGLYCLSGVVSFISQPGNYSTPQPCFPGAYCKPGSGSPYGAGLIPVGRYGPTPKNPGIVCPPRFFCGPMTGQVEPSPCRPGTFNALPGQANCTLAFEGSVAPAPMLSRPIPSPCGHVVGRKGATGLTNADLCPAGKTCGYGVAADVEPPICFEIPSTITDPAQVKFQCQDTFNQILIRPPTSGPIPVSGRVNKAVRQCCWTKDQVLWLADRVIKIFSAAQYTNKLLVRDAILFKETLNAIPSTTLNGMFLLDAVSDESVLISTFNVKTKKVRQRILYEIERHYTFRRPTPCTPGTFCAAGTCESYPAVDTAA
jgi:hypothetical protein